MNHVNFKVTVWQCYQLDDDELKYVAPLIRSGEITGPDDLFSGVENKFGVDVQWEYSDHCYPMSPEENDGRATIEIDPKIPKIMESWDNGNPELFLFYSKFKMLLDQACTKMKDIASEYGPITLFDPSTEEGKEAMMEWNVSFQIGSHFDGYDQYLVNYVFVEEGTLFFQGVSGENGCPEFTISEDQAQTIDGLFLLVDMIIKKSK